MAVSGIKIETDLKGQPETITINLKKNRKLAKVLQEMGIISSSTEVKQMPASTSMAEFTKDCYTHEEAIKESFRRIKKWGLPKAKK